MASEIRVNKINSRTGVGTITLSPTGVDFTGIATVATLKATTGIVTTFSTTGNATVGGTLGVTGETTFSTHVNLGDNNKAKFGDSDDLQIYHDSSNSWISDDGTGSLKIRSVAGQVQILGTSSNDNMAVFTVDGAAELYYDNTKRFETTTTGVKTLGDLSIRNSSNTQHILYDESESALEFIDNIKATFGTGNDLEIYHNGTDSVINDSSRNLLVRASGTGDLWLQSDNQVYFGDIGGNEKFIEANDNGDVKLFYDNSQKLATKSDGVVVTGGIYLDGSGGTNSANKLGDYEQGTWTPTASGTWSGFANSTITNSSATYTKIGRAVHIQTNITFPDSTGNLTVGDYVKLDGLPFNYGGSGDNVYNSIPSQVFVRDSTNGGVSHGYLISSNEVQVRVVAVYGSGARSQTGLKLSFTYFTD